MRSCDVSILFENKWTKNELEWLKEYYEQNILPLLTPTTLDLFHIKIKANVY